jgi:hypothetical protein
MLMDIPVLVVTIWSGVALAIGLWAIWRLWRWWP